MKPFFSIVMVCSLLLLAACGNSSEPKDMGKNDDGKKMVKIGIAQYANHPSLDGARKGFLQALKDAGYEENVNLQVDFHNAQGDMNNNLTIAQKLVGDKNDLILAIATPTAQAVAKATKDIPVLFTAVTDPVASKLVDSLEKPGGNVTGTRDTNPDAIKKTMETIKKFFPEARKIGVIYNSGEQNSVVNIANVKQVLQEGGLETVEAAVTNSSEVKQAADSLVGRADIIYLTSDNTVISALSSVVSVANDKDIPLFCESSESVGEGAFASIGFQYYDLGYTTGKMAVEVLKGASPADIPVQFSEKLDLMINPKAAEAQGITLTDEMTQGAILIEK
ncbi:ABC transporter substrate-binding protein [Paenibacillus melissococcoides]|uniref:ABC transporter substrate-binding protein n=1 Tax=Paenibacillus melissococcoides TaxID=2912268 RepID=A0ABM9G7G2_9BACL|nr:MULTISPECIES: ABC transporter substrate-binding protein [Paenibacillus]MEB9895179.1 ABC transporter substrate-binding protein [Bacillus cereus]CAH8247856.1 ABC transporter substrate-binding protein [Paenibacillus melissococcoides]CAH8719339.1 ABC transporter substrate-binding protein [Paenibacillus melissococcoides]CAH8720350.1 ABC transporter substrate-binding protein [Paenibacillus melissococcoides]GIO78858.1 ABC transporter substrate-binding protein [Paenibacillus dendritiformis]